VKADKVRISRYLTEINKAASELAELVRQNELKPDTIEIKAAKYLSSCFTPMFSK